MITVLLYLKQKRKPFELEFENKDKYYLFLEMLYANDVVTVGPITFAREQFRYLIKK